MTLHQLLILSLVFRHRSFRRVAEILRVSAPAISAQIKALEKELGHTLFRRQSGAANAEPTPAGEMVYEAALRIAEIVEDLRERLDCMSGTRLDERCHLLRVACDADIGTYTLPKLLRTRISAAGLPQLIVTITPFEYLPDVLSSCEYDLAIVPGGIATHGVVEEFTFDEPVVITANPTLVFPGRGRNLDLGAVPLVVPYRGSTLRRLIDNYFQNIGIKPNIVDQVISPEAAKELVRTQPVAIVTHRSSVREELERGTLVEFQTSPPMPRMIYKAVRSPSCPGTHIRGFAEFVREGLKAYLNTQ